VETVLATGRVVGEKTIPLSFIRPGRISEELIKDGQTVKTGQVLLRMETAQLETAVALRRTALSSARLSLQKLTTTDLKEAELKVRQARATAAYNDDFFKRQAGLFEQKTVTGNQLEQARRDKELADTALETAANQLGALQTSLKAEAELRIAQAEGDLRQSELDLREADLRAPYDGQIVEHIAHRGEFVAGGQRVITFIPTTPQTYVEVQVDEANLGKLALGQKASVSSAAFPGRAFPAVVERIASIVDLQRGTFAVRLVLDRLEPELLPESSVSVQAVVGERKGALLLEERFLVRVAGAASVFAIDGNRARRKDVTAVDLGNGLFSLESGLTAGDRVLLPQGLKDGLKIKPVPAQR
jgi:HlyD family secretion protein